MAEWFSPHQETASFYRDLTGIIEILTYIYIMHFVLFGRVEFGRIQVFFRKFDVIRFRFRCFTLLWVAVAFGIAVLSGVSDTGDHLISVSACFMTSVIYVKGAELQIALTSRCY